MPPLYYRGCWHRVSRGLFGGYGHYHPPQKEFTTRKPSSSTRRCSVRLAPIAENSLLLPPVGVWAVLSPSLAGRPHRPATRHRLGGPLPRQLPDGPRARLSAHCCFPPQSVCGISLAFAGLSPTDRSFPTCSSAVRHSPTEVDACDLHALGTPPAFVLSQDQTLHCWWSAVLEAPCRHPGPTAAFPKTRHHDSVVKVQVALKNQVMRSSAPQPGDVSKE